MKKLLAIIIAAALIVALFAVPSGAASNIIDADDANITAANLDDFLWTYFAGSGPLSAAASNVTDIRGWMNGFVNAGGLGQDYRVFASSFDKIYLRGWIGFDQEITMFGYQINDDEPVFDPYNATFAEATEDPVREAGGQYARRYRVIIPLSKGGQYSMRVVAKLADGTIVRLNGSKAGTNTEFVVANTAPVNIKSVAKVINYDESQQYGMSLDRIDWNHSQLVTENLSSRDYTDTFLDEDGKLDAVKYSGAAISFSGWVDFFQPVTGFGYMINDEVVLEPGYLCNNGEGLIETLNSWDGWDGTNAQRFYVIVPIGELTGENTVCAVAQLQDGTVVKLNSQEIHNRSTEFTIKGQPAPEETQPVTEPETQPANYELHGASFDTIYVNDVMNFGQDDGAASDKLDGVGRTIDGSDGSVQTIRIRGWIGFESEIDELGYQINGKNTFGDYKVAPEAAVTDPANGGQYATRFDMTIDVSNLKGTNKIVAVAKLADGTIVKIDENVSANGAGTTPNTSFTYIGPADENAQTGDMTVAMFAVIAVLALGAAVVFAKKRAF